jgi:hypothetical protein
MGIRKDTLYFCPACEGHPTLCIQRCFVTFHRNIRAWM